MSYGHLDLEQRQAVAQFVCGRVVHDFGAGDLGLAVELLHLGAKKIVAIDNSFPRMLHHDARIDVRRESFREVAEPVDVMFVSWPANGFDPDLALHAARAETVIYLGTNTGGRCCGSPLLFFVLIRRKLLAYVPRRGNTLVCVGESLSEDRSKMRRPTGEEAAGLLMYDGSVPKGLRLPIALQRRWLARLREWAENPQPRRGRGPSEFTFEEAEAFMK